MCFSKGVCVCVIERERESEREREREGGRFVFAEREKKLRNG